MHRGFALASLLLITSAAVARAADVAVPEDEARIIKFEKPVTTVYVANPMVADVNMIDSTHAFLLGKAYGATNMIAMDAQGNPIESKHVTVLGSSHLVTLNKGSLQYTFACVSARCEVAPTPGDSKGYHDDNMGEVAAREELGARQASAGEGH